MTNQDQKIEDLSEMSPERRALFDQAARNQGFQDIDAFGGNSIQQNLERLPGPIPDLYKQVGPSTPRPIS